MTRIGVARPSRFRGPSRFLGKIVEGVDHVIHFLQEVRLQSAVVRGPGIGLGQGREIMAGGVAAQPGGLVVPAAQLNSAGGLRQAEGVAEIIEEVVGIDLGQGGEEFVTVLHERRVPAVDIPVQDDAAQRERFQRPLRFHRRAGRFRRLDGHNGFRLERSPRHGPGQGISSGIQGRAVVDRRRPDDPDGRSRDAAFIDAGNLNGQTGQDADRRFHGDIGDVL